MKLFKKILMTLAVVCLAAVQTVSVSAESETSGAAATTSYGTLSVSNANEGSTYVFYRLLDAKVKNENEKDEDAAYYQFNTETSAYKNVLLSTFGISTDLPEATQISNLSNKLETTFNEEYQTTLGNNADTKWDPSTSAAMTLYNNLVEAKITPEYTIVAAKSTNSELAAKKKTIVTASNAKGGYYLIMELPASGNINSRSLAIMVSKQDQEDLNVTAKSDSVPTLDISVKNEKVTNTAGLAETAGWNTSYAASYSFGDAIPFEVEVSLPTELKYFSDYDLSVKVQLPAGLTYSQSAAYLYYDANNAKNPYSEKDKMFTPSYNETANTVTFTCVDPAALARTAEGGDKLIIRYYATFNTSAAVVGQTLSLGATSAVDTAAQGNMTTATMTYTNDAYNTDSEKDGYSTATVSAASPVSVYTFSLKINKVDSDKQPLAGAAFTLYKDSNTAINEEIIIATAEDEREDKVDNSVVKTKVQSIFTWTGIGAGTYTINETNHPDGYYAIGDINFVVTPTFTGYELTALTAKLATDATNADSKVFSTKVSTGEITTTVINNKGVSLPATGGMGTTLLIAGGAIVLGGALILVVARKKMQLQ
jgi:LPXTG-motif cell wall-anchored protein